MKGLEAQLLLGRFVMLGRKMKLSSSVVLRLESY